MTPSRIQITQTVKMRQQMVFSVCGRKGQLISFLLLSVILRFLSPPELISFSTSSCSNSLLLTDCQKCLGDKNVNFQITCLSDRSKVNPKINISWIKVLFNSSQLIKNNLIRHFFYTVYKGENKISLNFFMTICLVITSNINRLVTSYFEHYF